VEISASTNVQDGVYDIILLAESSEISENITLYIEVQSPSVEVKLKAIPPYLDVYSGSKAKFKIQVSNTGGKDNLLNVTSLGLPEEFKVKFEDSGGGEITAIYVEAGATKEFFVAVSVPENIKLGARKFTISIFNAEVEEKVDLTLNVLGLYRIAITNTNFYTTLNVGGEGTFTLSVKNTGSMEVTNVRVESVSVPEGFTIKMSPESIPSLKTNEERSFVITISSDPNVNAGNYYMNFNVLSDQTEKLSFSLRVEVFQTTNWLLYAGIGIIIALVFLVLIYRKFGRR
ncbi:MAG: NEW3 domain-containing protein, partial [Candidatus Bathyarchaeia archaeon]